MYIGVLSEVQFTIVCCTIMIWQQLPENVFLTIGLQTLSYVFIIVTLVNYFQGNKDPECLKLMNEPSATAPCCLNRSHKSSLPAITNELVVH